MSTMVAPLTVRTARYVADGPAPDRGRGRVGEALALVDPDAGLAPGAVLVVREVRGTVRGAPAMTVEGADLRAVARRAVRAADGLAAADAEAVVFANDAEVLIALARDVTAGRPLPWWWSTLFGRVPSLVGSGRAAFAAAAFVSRARAIPAAAATAPAELLRVADLLGTPAALEVLVEVARCHGAPDLAAAASAPAAAWPRAGAIAAPTGPTDGDPATAPGPPRRGVPSGPAAPPWRRWLDVPAGTAATGALALVGSAAALHLDPVRARSARFAEEVARVLAAPVEPAVDRLPFGPPPSTGARTHDPSPAAPTPPSSPVDRAALPVVDAAAHSMPDSKPLSVPTGWAGAVYLLALLDKLDLPATASGPGEPGAALTRWGVLALVLLGLGADPDDGLLRTVATIEGRATDQVAPPAADLDAVAFRVPRHALAWWPPPLEPWRWTLADGRIAVHDSTGLVVADVVLDPGDPVERAFAEAASAWVWPGPVRLEPEPTSLPPGLAPPLAVEPALRPWAVRAAGLLAAVLHHGRLDPAMLRVPGIVVADDLFVRITIAAEDVDLRVRRLGLDRDPGWVPALGRAVELTFR